MDYARARHNMIENQIRTNRVTDPLVIEAMADVPREVFLPKTYKGVAYVDEDLPLAEGRWLLEPLNMSRLLQAAEFTPDDIVLDVGCASGYSTAVLSKVSSTVVALESDEELANKATAHLVDLGIDNAAVVTGPLRDGFAKQGPYDVIFISSGSIPSIPDALRQQLAEGGRLVAVVEENGSGRVTVLSRHGDAFGHRVVFDGNSPTLGDFVDPEEFVF